MSKRWSPTSRRLQSGKEEREKAGLSSHTKTWQNDKASKEVEKQSAAWSTETQFWKRIRIAYWLLGWRWGDKSGFLKGGGGRQNHGFKDQLGGDKLPRLLQHTALE